MTDWTERYRPSSLSELRGNNSARDELREWARDWEPAGDAAIVHGPPGVGKTSAAHALAADMGWETVELNASDSRTKDDIQRLAGRAARNSTLGSGRQLIIVDEADNFHGNVDRGGSRAVTGIVKQAGQPIVLLANEFYEMSNGLRAACREIEFRPVTTRSILPVLRDICRKEDIEFASAALEAIAETNSGDLRGAINDLQAAAEGRDQIERADVVTGDRDRTEGIFEFLDSVIKEAGPQAALEMSYDVDETPDDLINWIEDNMPKDYTGAELADAYDALAAADRWLGRVRATQNYTFWRYATDNMTAGVAAARDGQKGGWTRYGPPSYWSKLGRSRGTRQTRDAVARQTAQSNGVSLETARRTLLPYLRLITHHCKNRELTVAMAAQYDLDAEHVSYVTGSGETTNKVQSIVERGQQLREEQAVEQSQGAFTGSDAGTTAATEPTDGAPTPAATTDGSPSSDGASGPPTATSESPGADAADETDETDTGADADDTDAENDQQAGLSDFT